MNFNTFLGFAFLVISQDIFSQKANPFIPDFSPPSRVKGMILFWSDEFNTNGKPDPKNWNYERGFVRNQELQWYQSENANCSNGVLVIEGRRENFLNPQFRDSSNNWKLNRQFINYTSASINTRGLHQFNHGRFEIRARIDTTTGSWPAIWTLGIHGSWPLNGEIDIMEFYRVDNIPTILANLAWGKTEKGGPQWNTKMLALSEFVNRDPEWVKKFHIWRMDWTKDSINLFLDNVLLNTGLLSHMVNPDGSNPFIQPQYLLLNLAIGSNGGDPAKSSFPIKYEVDYVRYYKYE